MPGRPSSRTEANALLILNAIEKGLPFFLAARLGNMSRNLLTKWRKEDPVFDARVEEAIARGVSVHIGKIAEASKHDWRASAWLLANGYGKPFGPAGGNTDVSIGSMNIVIHLPRKEPVEAKAIEAPVTRAPEARLLSDGDAAADDEVRNAN
jgi:hypothetical protein